MCIRDSLVYGVASAPSIFQHTMDTILQGIPKTYCYLDDILVQGGSYDECLRNVNQVLSRLNQFNVKLRPEKCVWFAETVEYLGHVISKDGRSPSPKLVTQLGFLKLLQTSSSCARTWACKIFMRHFYPILALL